MILMPHVGKGCSERLGGLPRATQPGSQELGSHLGPLLQDPHSPAASAPWGQQGGARRRADEGAPRDLPSALGPPGSSLRGLGWWLYL